MLLFDLSSEQTWCTGFTGRVSSHIIIVDCRSNSICLQFLYFLCSGTCPLTLSRWPLRHNCLVTWPTLTLLLSDGETIAEFVCCHRQTFFVRIYSPTIPTQDLDTLYTFKERAARPNDTITDHFWMTPTMLLGYLCWLFGATQGQKMMPWGITAAIPHVCLEASCWIMLGNDARHHA